MKTDAEYSEAIKGRGKVELEIDEIEALALCFCEGAEEHASPPFEECDECPAYDAVCGMESIVLARWAIDTIRQGRPALVRHGEEVLIRASRDLFEKMIVRNDRGDRLSIEIGKPDDDGISLAIATVDATDNPMRSALLEVIRHHAEIHERDIGRGIETSRTVEIARTGLGLGLVEAIGEAGR